MAKAALQVRMPEELLVQLRASARQNGRSLNAEINWKLSLFYLNDAEKRAIHGELPFHPAGTADQHGVPYAAEDDGR